MLHPLDPSLVASLAYQIWDRAGRPEGCEREHWQQAERQLSGEQRVAMPDATGDEDPDSYLSSSDSERAIAEREESPEPKTPAPF